MKPGIFLSVGIGPWYNFGVERLGGSLRDKGWDGDMRLFKDEWPDARFSDNCVYACKPAAFQWAIDQGYETIIWADASVTAIRNPGPMVAEVNQKGYWLGQSGYNCAQVCSDNMLRYFGVDRDWAETIPDSATGLFGVNLSNPVAREMIRLWIKAGQEGAFTGSRHHAGQSGDPRFLFGRQDQAAMSVIAGMMGVKLDSFLAHCKFVWDKDAGQEFHCQGM